MTPWRRLLAWYKTRGRDLPWRGEASDYQVAVSEFMLQQTQVDRVVPKFQAFMRTFPSWSALAGSEQADVVRAWQGLGYNMRALRLREMARTVIERFGGKLPESFEDLLSIKGVGPYTARALRVFVHRARHLAPDTNVRRVLTRFFLGPKMDPKTIAEKRWEAWEATVPARSAYDVNQALMDLGSAACKAGVPDCASCPLMQACASYPTILSMSRLRIPKTKKPGKERVDKFGVPDRIYRGRVIERLRKGPTGLAEITRICGDHAAAMRIIAKLKADGLVLYLRHGTQELCTLA